MAKVKRIRQGIMFGQVVLIREWEHPKNTTKNSNFNSSLFKSTKLLLFSKPYQTKKIKQNLIFHIFFSSLCHPFFLSLSFWFIHFFLAQHFSFCSFFFVSHPLFDQSSLPTYLFQVHISTFCTPTSFKLYNQSKSSWFPDGSSYIGSGLFCGAFQDIGFRLKLGLQNMG